MNLYGLFTHSKPTAVVSSQILCATMTISHTLNEAISLLWQLQQQNQTMVLNRPSDGAVDAPSFPSSSSWSRMIRFQKRGRILTRGLIAGLVGFTVRWEIAPSGGGGGGGAGAGGTTAEGGDAHPSVLLSPPSPRSASTRLMSDPGIPPASRTRRRSAETRNSRIWFTNSLIFSS